MPNHATPFWYLGIVSAFSLLTFDLYQPALPAITQYFNTTQALGQLTLSLFFLVFGLSQLIWGPLIDHFGRKNTLRISLVIFVFATMVCIFSTTIEMLIAGRIAQGFAVCCSNIVAFSSSRDYGDSTDRAKIISHITMIVAVSPIFAPLIGSLIFLEFGWHAIFIFMIILALFIFLLISRLLSESPVWQKPQQKIQLRHSVANYRKLFGNSQLWLGILIVTASFSCILAVIVNAAYLVIDYLNHSPLFFSLAFACNGLMLILGNYVGIRLRDKKSLAWNIHLGSLLMVFGSLIMLMLFLFIGLNMLSLSPLLLIAFGVSIISPPAFSLVLADYEHQAATATAFINTARMVISSIVASLISVFIITDIKLLPISLLFCSLICWIVSLFITETRVKIPKI
ncbi:MAG: multidrug effflux MFS transporter [Tatlockia sp.]|nr:multidrug effflux MFS transporter [Tatlockia sp.]